ncbi:hypothetical protein [Streptomyces sp. P9-2]
METPHTDLSLLLVWKMDEARHWVGCRSSWEACAMSPLRAAWAGRPQ